MRSLLTIEHGMNAAESKGNEDDREGKQLLVFMLQGESPFCLIVIEVSDDIIFHRSRFTPFKATSTRDTRKEIYFGYNVE